jgi:hypothetical protein
MHTSVYYSGEENGADHTTGITEDVLVLKKKKICCNKVER